MRILITGAAGYIGSHAVVGLQRQGHEVQGLDDFRAGRPDAPEHLGVPFHVLDAGDEEAIFALLREESFDCVQHFAADVHVSASVGAPLATWENNVGTTTRLLSAVRRASVPKFVLSSTCAVLGDSGAALVHEDDPVCPMSPYGSTKAACERLLEEEVSAAASAGSPFSAAVLRYFNVCGAGAGPFGEPIAGSGHDVRLSQVLLDVVQGRREHITIFGTDYATPDGTCVRDYIHVDDVVAAHSIVGDRLKSGEFCRYHVGTGKSTSVYEAVEAARRASSHPIPAILGNRRPGDADSVMADSSRLQALGWTPGHLSFASMFASALNHRGPQ
ncbi:MAG: UDP-glucose 4-epimerase GalE [Planctomycetota bacterium]|nr:UDP-glucose 4-epimerase GalE [Planctomycetota bacterium]